MGTGLEIEVLRKAYWKGWTSRWFMVKNLPASVGVQETWVWSLGQEEPLEEEMATHLSIVTGKIPRTEEPCGLQSMGSQRVRHD